MLLDVSFLVPGNRSSGLQVDRLGAEPRPGARPMVSGWNRWSGLGWGEVKWPSLNITSNPVGGLHLEVPP